MGNCSSWDLMCRRPRCRATCRDDHFCRPSGGAPSYATGAMGIFQVGWMSDQALAFVRCWRFRLLKAVFLLGTTCRSLIKCSSLTSLLRRSPALPRASRYIRSARKTGYAISFARLTNSTTFGTGGRAKLQSRPFFACCAHQLTGHMRHTRTARLRGN